MRVALPILTVVVALLTGAVVGYEFGLGEHSTPDLVESDKVHLRLDVCQLDRDYYKTVLETIRENWQENSMGPTP